MDASGIGTAETSAGGSKTAGLAWKIIAFFFLAFSSANILLTVRNYEYRHYFPLFRGNMKLWILFLAAATAVFLLLLLLLRGPISFVSDRKALCYAVTVLAALVPRLLAIGVLDVSPVSDFRLYHNIASELLNGEVFGKGYISLFPHTFGYPAILSLLYRIFGPYYPVGQVFNAILGIGISVLLFQAGDILFGRRAGLTAALFWALWPSQVLYSLLLCTEVLFTFLMLLCIRVFISITGKEKWNMAALAGLGLLCAFANSIRPLGIILILSFIIVLFLAGRPGKYGFIRSLAGKMAPCLVLAASYFIAAYLMGIGLSGIIQKDIARFPAGFNLLTGSNIKYSGTWNGEDSGILESFTGGREFDAQEVQDAVMDIAIRRYIDQGAENLRLFYRKYIIMWASDDEVINYISAGLDQEAGESGFFNELGRYLKLACNLYYLFMMCLCLVFAIHLARRGTHASAYALLLFILGTASAHLLLEAAGRYHYPAISMFSLLAGAGLHAVLYRNRAGNASAGRASAA